MSTLGLGLQIIALCFIMFITGAAIARFQLFPYGYLKDAFDAADALMVRERGKTVPFAVGAKPVHPEDWPSPAVREPGLVGLGRYSATIIS